LAPAIAQAAKAHDATVLHAHHYTPFVYSAIANVMRPRTRVIFTEHGRLSDKGPSAKRRAVNRVLSYLPAGVFSVSAELGEHLVAEGFRRNQVKVVYNGIDVGPATNSEDRAQVRRELGVGDTTCVVGTIARLDPVKDLGNLIAAIGMLNTAGEQLAAAVIGDGPERAGLAGQAISAGLGRTVRFLGQRTDARRWLAGCDVYVNCSTSEGVSLTILEAMAAGLPIIATAVGGTPEVVDNTCGRLVPARNPTALAEAIKTLMHSPSERANLGKAARARVESRFTLDRMIAEYKAVYVRN